MSSELLRLLAPPRAQRRTWLACVALAAALHVTGVKVLPADAPITRVPNVTEVELATVTPDPPPAAPKPPPPPPAAVEPPRARQPPRARMAEPPPAARAGALLTAPELPTPANEPEPVRFVSDPNGAGFGYGLVARGGTAEQGTGPQLGAATATSRPARGQSFTPADRLQRQPILLGHDGCRGYFPAHAHPNQGLVAVVASVRASGAIARLEIESETPPGQGFADAARACLKQQHFSAALDETGQPTAARTRITLRFSR